MVKKLKVHGSRALGKSKINSKRISPVANMVLPHLYIGSIESRTLIPKLKIRHVFCFISSIRTIRVNEKTVNEYYYLINDSRNTNLKPILDKCLSQIHQARVAKENVLVHCKMGKSRSAAIIIAYLMKYEKMCFSDAFTHLKNKRSCINPNVGFIDQLVNFNTTIQYT